MAKKKAAKPSMLLSDDSTIELVLKAQEGNRLALEALLQRCLPSLRRWAHGKLPPAARDAMNTDDLLQEVALKVLVRLDKFEPRHVGSMQAFLRKAVLNKVRDEVRRVSRRPILTEPKNTIPSDDETPEETFIRNQTYDRYRAALRRLTSKDRELVVARIEPQWAIQQIMESFGFVTIAAARMAVTRALRRLMNLLEADTAPPKRKASPRFRADC